MAGLYVHIPFCVSRCIYCAFCATTQLTLRDRYLAALQREYSLRRGSLRGAEIETVYIGGGTPSVLTRRQLTTLLTALPLNSSNIKEATIECNPDDITPSLVALLRDNGITRLSMGIQTFDDDRLRFLHRRHTAQQAREAVHIVREEGIDDISIDLMFAFPHESNDDWQRDIDSALALAVPHISAYSLQYEEGTALFRQRESGQVQEIDEEDSRAMYYTLLARLTAAGYEHYEISNFCRQGHRAKHNSSYWHNSPYLGIGAAAHSYDGTARQSNTTDIAAYMAAIEQGTIPCEREVLTPDMRYNDMIATALRTSDGIALAPPFHNRDYLLAAAQPFLRRGQMEIVNGRLRIAQEALYIADSIMAELVRV